MDSVHNARKQKPCLLSSHLLNFIFPQDNFQCQTATSMATWHYMRTFMHLYTLTCLKSVPRSDTRKERFRRSLRVPRKERQSRSCHGMGKFIFFYFFSFSGIFLDGWFSARAKIMGLPLIRVDSTFVLGYCSYFGMHTLTLVIKLANIFEKWFFFKKSCCRCL